MSLPASIILSVHILMAILIAGSGLAALFSEGPVSVLPRRSALIGIILLLVTGANNFLQRLNSGVPKGYHMWFGIKFLLALHILTIIFLLSGGTQTPEKRTRLLKGVGVSTVAVVMISVYLNYLVTGAH